ncbi:hypothetical protein ACLOJK_016785 [Asimina triloba]
MDWVNCEMSGVKDDFVKEQDPAEDPLRDQIDEDIPTESSDPNKSSETSMPSAQAEEEVIKKKYGGILPKKPPLICKQGQKPKGPLEALRPKLQVLIDFGSAFFILFTFRMGKWIPRMKTRTRASTRTVISRKESSISQHHINKFVPGDQPMLLQTVKELLMRFSPEIGPAGGSGS